MSPADAQPRALHRNLERIEHAVLMLVDDEPLNVELLQAHLEEVGYRHFVGTSEAREAVELARRHQPDVMLLDLQMPHVSGLDILAAVRADAALAGTAVLIVTSSLDHQARLRALALGATDFLHKPVDPAELSLRLKNTLEAKAWRDRVARTDLATGLPNLAAATEHLQRAIAQAAHAGSVAVLQVAVDAFGEIQALGASAGDRILQELAVRLASVVATPELAVDVAPAAALVARDSGDAFTLVVPRIRDAEAVLALAERLQRSVARPVECAGDELTPTCSIGISLYPADAASAGDLVAAARAALDQARREGPGRIRCYGPEINARARQKLALVADLRRAASRGELFLVFQSQHDVRTGSVVGAEALLRWLHPRRGLVGPGEFIPLAEESELIVQLGDWVLREVVRQLQAWKADGLPLPRVSVNVSASQLHDRGLLDTMADLLRADPGLSAHLCLELTERIMLEEDGSAAEVLHALRRQGVQLSLDDFGTGYSCLSYLQRLPFDELKIDRSFVSGLGEHEAPLVTAIIAMGRALGCRIVAEGVEHAAQLAWLREAGCDEYQGWLASRPVEAREFAQVLRRGGAPASCLAAGM